MNAPGRLSILFCTIGKRIARLPQFVPPPCEGVCYVVSWQDGGETLPAAVGDFLRRRRDTTLLRCPGTGISRNRNHALAHCRTELAALADDDVRYRPEQLRLIMETARQNPGTDIFCFQATDATGRPLKSYSPAPFRYAQRPRGTYFSSIEIVVRRRKALPAFDERFGLGAPCLSCGEEEVFLHEASLRSLRICYHPVPICATADAATTGSRFGSDAGVRRAKGAVLCLLHGLPGAVARCLKFYLTHLRNIPLSSLADMLAGIRYIRRTGKC